MEVREQPPALAQGICTGQGSCGVCGAGLALLGCDGCRVVSHPQPLSRGDPELREDVSEGFLCLPSLEHIRNERLG